MSQTPLKIGDKVRHKTDRHFDGGEVQEIVSGHVVVYWPFLQRDYGFEYSKSKRVYSKRELEKEAEE